MDQKDLIEDIVASAIVTVIILYLVKKFGITAL